MSKPLDVQAAGWLIVGFNKCWTMQMLAIRLRELGGQHFEFMPTTGFWYGSQVRAFVAQNWPKLHDFLDTASIERQLKAAAQIVRLRPTVERPWGSLTVKERAEVYKDEVAMRRAMTTYNHSRKLFTQGKVGGARRGVAR